MTLLAYIAIGFMLATTTTAIHAVLHALSPRNEGNAGAALGIGLLLLVMLVWGGAFA